jgi:Asp/Glu/hydantoin racemase
MKILVVNPFADTEFRGRENLERIKRSDTTFEIVNIANEYPLKNNQFLYFRYMCTGPTIDRIIQAEKEDYDAVFISCNLDIGLYEARSLVNIPVTTTLESAALVAYTMGTRISLLSVDDQNARIQKMILGQYGLDGKWVSNRSIWIDANDLYPDKTPEVRVYEKTLEAARKAVTEDGAEVLIAGCTLVGSVLTHRVKDPIKEIGAPVIDGMVTGFKMAEMMADICKLTDLPPVSRTGFFQFPPQEDYEVLRTFLRKSC